MAAGQDDQEIGGSHERGSLTVGWPVCGVGVIVSAPGAYPPTRLMVAPLLTWTLAELPFELRAPPFAAVQAESTWTAPSKMTVLLPEIRTEGHPRNPFGQDVFEGSSSTTEYLIPPGGLPFRAWLVVATHLHALSSVLVDHTRTQFELLAAEHHAHYDGWEADRAPG